MNILLIDTETTGLLLPDGAPLEKQPRIIEFAGVLYNENLLELERLDFMCSVPFPLPSIIIKTTGIKDKDLEGKEPFEKRHKEVINIFKKADYIVAHNVFFDLSMVRNELKRIKDEDFTADDWIDWKSKKNICTVECTHYIKNKRIKLSTAYEHFTGKTPQVAHRAINDVETMLEIVKHLVKEGELIW